MHKLYNGFKEFTKWILSMALMAVILFAGFGLISYQKRKIEAENNAVKAERLMDIHRAGFMRVGIDDVKGDHRSFLPFAADAILFDPPYFNYRVDRCNLTIYVARHSKSDRSFVTFIQPPKRDDPYLLVTYQKLKKLPYTRGCFSE